MRVPLTPGTVLALAAALTSAPIVRGADPAWNTKEAAKYLDGRQKAWFEYANADLGEGGTKTSCLCCHTLVTYALARPVLRQADKTDPTEYEKKLLAQTQLRVEKWADLDTPKLGLMYDYSEDKKNESWGTESVLNAVLLAFDDRYREKKAPSDSTKKAFANLWKAQLPAGDRKGSWEWLEFGLEPWESKNARYYGACLAAVAVATAPGYYAPGADSAVDGHVAALHAYLKDKFEAQNLYNQTWALWASVATKEVLSADQRKALIAKLFEKQQADGGWSLSALGKYVRGDGTPQETVSDGYATGLVLHVVQLAGVGRDDPRVAKGLEWLRTNQEASGEWKAYSLNKKRTLTTHTGRFMADAATAYAVLALSH